MKVELENKALSLLENLFFNFDRRIQQFYLKDIIDACKFEYFDKAIINYFSKEGTEAFGTVEGVFSWETITSYISIKLFREDKHVKTIRIKESTIDNRTEAYVNLLKSNLEKVDLLKY